MDKSATADRADSTFALTTSKALAEAPPEMTPANGTRRRRVTIAAALLAIGGRYYAWAAWHESTDDAFIDGQVIHVAPQVAGRVLRVLVTDNQAVKAGHLFVEIDPADFMVKLDQAVASQVEARGRLAQTEAQRGVAEAGEAQAEADIVAAKADAANARADLARYQATTSGAVSKQSVDSAKTAAERTAAQLTVAQKKASAAAAQVELARDLYVHGLGTYLAVLDAERTAYTAEDALAQGDESLVADLIATYKALGGGWELADDAGAHRS